jgi:hypothetical protein
MSGDGQLAFSQSSRVSQKKNPARKISGTVEQVLHAGVGCHRKKPNVEWLRERVSHVSHEVTQPREIEDGTTGITARCRSRG